MAIRYAIQGDLRFISHQDTLRLFTRALARAGVPVRFSQGFNPRPRLSLPLPRPLGVASRCELLVLEMDVEQDPAAVLSRLSRQMPSNIELLSAERLADQDRRLPSEVHYSLALDPRSCRRTELAAAEFLARKSVVVDRANAAPGASKKVDIRPFVLSVAVEEGMLRWAQAVTATGTARVGEVLDVVGLPSAHLLHRVERQAIIYRP